MSHRNGEMELKGVNPSTYAYSEVNLGPTRTSGHKYTGDEPLWIPENHQARSHHPDTRSPEIHGISYSQLPYQDSSEKVYQEQAKLQVDPEPYGFKRRLQGWLGIRAWKGDEHSKTVCSNSRSAAMQHFALFHFPSIAVTLFLFGLYISHFRWTPPHPTGDELSALQFAAKAHETMILVSLADILLHRVLYGVPVEDGIPLGFLSSVFSLGAPIQYLISWEFWPALLNPTANRAFHQVTGAMIGFILPLSLAASPFSATAMIPRQAWWNFDGKLMDGFPPYTAPVYYISGDPAKLQLDSDDVFMGESIFCNTDVNITCQKPTHETIVQNFLPVFWYSFSPFLLRQENMTYSATAIARKDRPMSLSIKSQEGPVVLATCPMSFVADAYAQKFQETSSGTKKWKQPLIAGHCNRTWAHNTTATFEFNGGFLDDTLFSLGLENEPALENMTKGTEPGIRAAVILDIKNKTISDSISTAIMFGNRVASEGADLEGFETNDTTVLGLGLCLVSARWVEAENWILREDSVAIMSDLVFPNTEYLDYLRDTATEQEVIKMTSGWLKAVSRIVASNENMEYISVNQAASQLCSSSVNGFAYTCLAMALGAHLTDALAQPLRLRSYEQNNASDPYPSANDTIIKTTHWKFTYTYELADSFAIPLALSVLLLHVCIAVVHMATILLSPNPWHGSSWGSFGQMLVLALRSRVDGLDNAGGGVSSSQTWEKTTTVRDVGQGQLQMMVQKRERDDVIQDRTGESVGDPQPRRVQTGMRYS
ncbi:hypothetical protein EDB81DRAFT_934367 [Dactylonectria macrodidyma]|uniref:Uncharacterized protein n=1 Tax=Dactylonectria macrodidyma TaxID=307937 RepID=A0A9P9EWG8_9HYPO|nr:hypothetical protein EDB81DRAFT_934367 [Dactylonectria macrodidyma]